MCGKMKMWVWFCFLSLSWAEPQNIFRLYQDTSHEVFHGHTSSCFEYSLLSYQSCLQLFLSSSAVSCSYMKYSNQICSLHNHNHPSFLMTTKHSSHPHLSDMESNSIALPHHQITAATAAAAEQEEDGDERNNKEGIIILTKLSNLSTSTPLSSNSYQQLFAIKKYRKCLEKKKNQEEIVAKFLSLPKLAIVISVTSEWVQQHEGGVKSLTSNFQCYAQVHNYSFVSLSSISTQPSPPSLSLPL